MLTTQDTADPSAAAGELKSPVRGWLGVAAITAGLFVFLTTERMPIGLLTPIGESLGVSVGAVGLMVTAQGVAAGLGVPFIVAWSRRVDRRRLLTAGQGQVRRAEQGAGRVETHPPGARRGAGRGRPAGLVVPSPGRSESGMRSERPTRGML
ncbi:MFS transporter [Streptomyces sp. SM13]|uniref:MFS transporter n=1 Tax=Streptomyces sp. SM13 TaxID=1983803 RepID=UPI00215645E0|nr:MFS transporter [Streptomyces sp. SM13]